MRISDEAVEAARKALWELPYGSTAFGDMPDAMARLILEAAAPHMLAEADLMRWKLDALREWADAMINESNSPQYGRDVRTLLEVGSMDEAREIDAL